MSKQFLKEIFSNMYSCEALSLQLLQVKTSSRTGTAYISREIEIKPDTKLTDYVKHLSETYSKENGIIDSFSSVDKYTGDVVNHVVYRIAANDLIIRDELFSLKKTVADPSREALLMDIKPTALLLQCTVKNSHREIGDTSVMLISMQNPLTMLSNKFLFFTERSFHEISAPVLTLKNTVDVAIIGDTVYLFSLSGEKLFAMERSYKALEKIKADEIAKCGFLSDPDTFKAEAAKGRNPRRFVSFNQSHYEALRTPQIRNKIAEKFSIPIKNDMIMTDKPESVENLIKFLCDKAMLDPCDESPMEVASSKPWGK